MVVGVVCSCRYPSFHPDCSMLPSWLQGNVVDERVKTEDFGKVLVEVDVARLMDSVVTFICGKLTWRVNFSLMENQCPLFLPHEDAQLVLKLMGKAKYQTCLQNHCSNVKKQFV